MPEMNRGFDSVEQAMIQFETVDMSVAVGFPDGLITPILRHADYKTLSELSVEMKELSKRAKEGTYYRMNTKEALLRFPI